MNKIGSFSGDYAFLSNFYVHPITYFGHTFPSTENAYQAAKVEPLLRTCLWYDHLTCTPAQSKKLGRKLPLREGWDSGIKDQVMKEVLEIKFSDPILARKLLETGDAELVEGNYWKDFYWGICNGTGENKLGKLLMQLRTKIRLEQILG